MSGFLKTTLTCLIVAMLWNIVATQTLSVFNPVIEEKPRDIFLACGLLGHWATISRFNSHDPQARGYDPSCTVIFSRYQPVVHRVGERWQITFQN